MIRVLRGGRGKQFLPTDIGYNSILELFSRLVQLIIFPQLMTQPAQTQGKQSQALQSPYTL